MSEWIDIGEQLSKARKSKDLELMDIAHSTRIPLATLSALEENDYSIFPSPAYARSFLAQYSEYLGVDAHEWLEAFENEDVLSNVNEHSYLQPRHDHIGDFHHNPEPARRRSKATDKYHHQSTKGLGESHLLQTLTVFLVTALLIGGGIYAYKKYEPMLTGSRSEPQESPDAASDVIQDAVIQDAVIQDAGPAAIQTETNTMTSSEPTSPTPTSPSSPAISLTAPTTPAAMVEPNSPALLKDDPATTTEISDNPGDTQNPAALQTPDLTKTNRSGPPPKAVVIDEGEE